MVRIASDEPIGGRLLAPVRGGLLWLITALMSAGPAYANAGVQLAISDNVGHPTFASPHANPIAYSRGYVYVVNTPADTLDVIRARTGAVVIRINVGVDPVSVAVRPDRREVWVVNHVSDSVSVIDARPTSSTFHQVVHTVQDLDAGTYATNFDEPVGIAFASNSRKAYVALSPANRVAIIDVATRSVAGHLPIRAQEPRALAVHGDRLFVLPFESNNQSQLSGCLEDDIDGDTCTFDAVEHVFTNNNVLSTHYDADIVKNPELPDRDMFVFNTRTDRPQQIVESLGTLLYGLAIDSQGRVFIAQTDARNVENGRAGTEGHGLAEMENRAFLNQITRVDCSVRCGVPTFFDLEPLPPSHPETGQALATPFGIQVSPDDSTLVVTAAGSDKLFTMDADTGEVLGRVSVESTPRGVALVSDRTGALRHAWVLNAVANTVSQVNLADTANPALLRTVTLADPTPEIVKQGRMAFNDADASSTGTFSCESCHPDNHTDQLIWVLETPVCDVDGCTQIPPRLTMPAKGLRDTQPYHWDGIPGDPYGGNNTQSINAPVEPNCSIEDPASCTRVLVDGSMATTMCDVGNCPANDEGKLGLLDAAARDALAEYLLSVPFAPAPSRAYHNVLSQSAQDGFFEFNFINDTSEPNTGTQTCGACHRMPFLVSTNTPGTGMEAPTWRGAYERWMITPQARLNIIDLLQLVNMDTSFPERDMWILAGASDEIWDMVLEGSTGFSGSFARQVTLNEDTAELAQTAHMLGALERSANQGAVMLQAEGLRFDEDGAATPVALEYRKSRYRNRPGDPRLALSRARIVRDAAAGSLLLTITARAGVNTTSDHAQPALWPVGEIEAQTRGVDIPFLAGELTLRFNARHIESGATVFVDGRKASATLACESGDLPACDDEVFLVTLARAPTHGGLHFLQLQNRQGLFSNDMLFFSEQTALRPRRGNLITSGGTFNNQGQFRDNWNTVEIATDSIEVRNGAVRVNLRESSEQPWHAQISHSVMVIGGQEYTLCYRAKATSSRHITAYMDTNLDNWSNISGGQFRAELTTSYARFRHTFTVEETDLTGRVAFDFAQSSADVDIDDVGVYEGASCGTP